MVNLKNWFEAIFRVYFSAKAKYFRSSLELETNGHGKLGFVTGFDKSGTTWVMSILNHHNNVVARGSGQFYNLYNKSIPYLLHCGGFIDYNLYFKSSKWFSSSGNTWISDNDITNSYKNLIQKSLSNYKASNIKIVIDKSTCQNLFIINEHFEESYKIVLIRDGRDVINSFAHHLRRRGNNKIFEGDKISEKFIFEASQAWAYYNEHVLDYYRKYPKSMLLLKYEELLENPKQWIMQLYDYLGLEYNEAYVDKIVRNTSFKIQSGGRDSGIEDNASFYRKGIVGDWKNYFTSTGRDLFIDHAGECMINLGYIIK